MTYSEMHLHRLSRLASYSTVLPLPYATPLLPDLGILAIWRKSGLKSGTKGRGFYGTARTMHILATPYKSRGIVFLRLLPDLGILASRNPQIGVA